MTRIYLLLAAAVCLGVMDVNVTAATRTSVQSGAWSAASTWDTGIPATGDSVIVANGHVVNLSANASIGTGAGATVTVQSGGVLDLSSFLLTANTLTIDNGGEVKQGGSATSPSGSITTRSYAPNSTYTFNGTQLGLSGVHPVYGNLIFAPTPGSAGTFGLNLSVAGSLTINLGAVQEIRFSTGTTGRTHNIGGDLNIQAGLVVGSNGSSLAGSATVTIGGKLNITGGTLRGTNDVGDATFNVGGNVANGGTWQQDDGSSSGLFSINLNGTISQDISGANPISFENLIINNPSGVTLSRNADLTRTLTLTSGDLVTGTNLLTMPAAATSAGTTDVVGNVLRTGFSTGGSALSFGNPLNTIAVTSGSAPANIIVNLVKGSPTDFANAVRRTYTITPNAAGFTATLQLHYNDSELNGNAEASLVLWRNDAGVWSNQGGTDTDDAINDNNFVQLAGVTQFSSWTISGPGAPTAVQLTKFAATSFAGGVQLNWQSGYEVDNLGYHLYREEQGKRTRVTPALVAGSALSVGPARRLTAGYSYSWFDQKGTPETGYYLEAIDLDGTRDWYGPIYPQAGTTVRVDPRSQALGLSELAGTSTASDKNVESPWPTQMKAAARRETRDVTAASLALQQSIAARKAIKIEVNRNGWYRLTQPELVAAGLDPSVDAQRLQLFVDGSEVPIELSSNGSQLDTDATLEFYGVGLDTLTTDTRTYWLIEGDYAGKRISLKGNEPKGRYQNIASPSSSFLYTVERRERLIYSSHLLNGDASNIFGAPVLSQPVKQTLTIRNLDPESSLQAQLEVALQGFTTQSHEVQVRFNGSVIGTINFAGSEHLVTKFDLNRAHLQEGVNEVSLVARNGDLDISFIDSIQLTYAHRYSADNNELAFSVPAGQTVRVSGFSSANVRVIDVTDPDSPLEVAAALGTSTDGYAVSVPAMGNQPRTMLAFTDDLSRRPVRVFANKPSNWNASANAADMVIITHNDFREAIEPLAALRRSQGMAVAVVDVEDVYDEFSYGAHTPWAIKSFLARATGNWIRKPQYLLLVGDSSWDPRDYFQQGAHDFVPTRLIDTAYMETASDDWFVDFDGSGLPAMALGRLPVRTAAEASLVVAKILSYEQERELNAPLRGAVMVADIGFESKSSQTKGLLPTTVTVQSINRGDVGNDDITRGQILTALNQGPMIVNFYGHGSVDVWTGAGLLDSGLARSLTNTNTLSLYLMMTCLNGYAHDPFLDSLSESALKAPQGGAVAVWASSGFTEAAPQLAMNLELYRQLFGGQTVRLGQAIRLSKAATTNQDVRRTWILFGDPAMPVR